MTARRPLGLPQVEEDKPDTPVDSGPEPWVIDNNINAKDYVMLRFRLALGVVGLLASGAVAAAANIPVSVGLNPIAIPFVPSLNYNATNIFTTPYDGEVIHRWDVVEGIWQVFTYGEGAGWDPLNPTLNAGEGIYYQARVARTFVANLEGNVVPAIAASDPVGPPPPLLPNRYYFRGSPTGQGATYEEIFQAPPNNETALFRFIPGGTDINPTGPDYRVYHYKDNVWTPQTPILDPLEPAFVVFPYLSLKYALSGDPTTINLTWPARGKLEAAPLPGGPWELVTTEGNSYSITPGARTNAARYYRVKE
jgi:hypothetical protein